VKKNKAAKGITGDRDSRDSCLRLFSEKYPEEVTFNLNV
jgi:hypothetical protein